MGKTGESNEMLPTDESSRIILYTTDDGKAQVSLMSRDGRIWLNQKQLAELFAVTKPNISMLISKIFAEKELDDSVVKLYLTTAADGKQYKVIYYALEMILAVGFRVRGVRGTQFRQWANAHLSEYLVKGFTIRGFRSATQGRRSASCRRGRPTRIVAYRGRGQEARRDMNPYKRLKIHLL